MARHISKLCENKIKVKEDTSFSFTGANEALDLKAAIHVGHSTGGREVVFYIGRHGTSRVNKAVLIGAIPPVMLKSETNPGGLPIGVLDEIRASVLADRSKFWKDLSMPYVSARSIGLDYQRPRYRLHQY